MGFIMLYNEINKLKSDRGYRTDYIEDYPIKKVCLFRNLSLIDITATEDNNNHLKFYPGYNEFIISLPEDISVDQLDNLIEFTTYKKNMEILTDILKKFDSLPLLSSLDEFNPMERNKIQTLLNTPDMKQAYIWSRLRGSEEFIKNNENLFNDNFHCLVDNFFNNRNSNLDKIENVLNYTYAKYSPHWTIGENELNTLKQTILNDFIIKIIKKDNHLDCQL